MQQSTYCNLALPLASTLELQVVIGKLTFSWGLKFELRSLCLFPKCSYPWRYLSRLNPKVLVASMLPDVSQSRAWLMLLLCSPRLASLPQPFPSTGNWSDGRICVLSSAATGNGSGMWEPQLEPSWRPAHMCPGLRKRSHRVTLFAFSWGALGFTHPRQVFTFISWLQTP